MFPSLMEEQRDLISLKYNEGLYGQVEQEEAGVQRRRKKKAGGNKETIKKEGKQWNMREAGKVGGSRGK